MTPLSLTIEGHSFTIPHERWFYYTGTLRSSPSWFLDLLEDHPHLKLPTGVIVIHNLANGSIDLQPQSLVFCSTTSVEGKTLYALQQLRVTEGVAQA